MTADVLAVGSDVERRRKPAVAVIGRTEARRILRSPAALILTGYLVVLAGVDTLTTGDGSAGIFERAARPTCWPRSASSLSAR